MRIRLARIATLFIVVVNIVALYFTWKLISNLNNGAVLPVTQPTVVKSHHKHISKTVTIVIRQFEHFENDIRSTVDSFLTLFPNIQILILCDNIPYPPIELHQTNSSLKNVRLFNMGFNIKASVKERNPLISIKTKYVLILPDSARISTRQVLQNVIIDLSKQTKIMVAIPFPSTKISSSNCLKVDLNIQEWYIKYSEMDVGDFCDAVIGKHAIMVETNTLKKFADTFMLPFPEALYLQATAHSIKTKLLRDAFIQDGRSLYHSQHASNRIQSMLNTRRKQMYSKISIKKVTLQSGNIQWYGCSKETKSCIGTVIDSTPYYLYDGKYTPPCCLNGLKKTAKHVFDRLEEAGIRYWLDGTSLLGSVRTNDIIPWDSDIIVGMYSEDLVNCHWLERARNRPITDDKGFVWQKATQGDFYKVQFSKTNNLHVTVLPYKVKNGTMVRDNWVIGKSHLNFSDSFLHPMSSIMFIGRQVPSPNSVRDFLEQRFGKGVIENTSYPVIKRNKQH